MLSHLLVLVREINYHFQIIVILIGKNTELNKNGMSFLMKGRNLFYFCFFFFFPHYAGLAVG